MSNEAWHLITADRLVSQLERQTRRRQKHLYTITETIEGGEVCPTCHHPLRGHRMKMNKDGNLEFSLQFRNGRTGRLGWFTCYIWKV